MLRKFFVGVLMTAFFGMTSVYAGAETATIGGLLQSDLRTELTQKLEAGAIDAELAKLGVQKDEVQARLAAMSDTELQQLVNGEHRQAGGDAVVISTTAILLVVLILILILRPWGGGGGGGTTVVAP